MNTPDYILSLADRCVKCGLCQPQCPTYSLDANENESPRGRIALVQAWLSGQLKVTSTLTQHIDHCLLCRRCERLCPSNVPFAQIIDESKALLNKQTATKRFARPVLSSISLKLLLNKNVSHYMILILRLLQKIRVIQLINITGISRLIGLQRLIDYLPLLSPPLKSKDFYPASKTEKGRVALFTGCVSKQLDPGTVKASIRLLNQLGYGVYIPNQQVCCGALHLHEGNKKEASRLAQHNTLLFNTTKDIDCIISIVNGCSIQLREYPQLDNETNFTTEVKDIIEFLADIEWPSSSTFRALNKKVALQLPCSLQNSLRAEDKLLTLLRRIPDVSLSGDAIYTRCCGAAGSYFLRFPETSTKLRANALQSLQQTGPELIISSNIGCALQLKAGLKQQKHDIPVIHPVILLEQQLDIL